jgi:hypothetical protein
VSVSVWAWLDLQGAGAIMKIMLVWQVLTGLVLSLCLLYLAVRVEEARRIKTIKSLVATFKALKVGMTTEPEAIALTSAYGAESYSFPRNRDQEAGASLFIRIMPPYLNLVIPGSGPFPRPYWLPGFHMWAVTAYLEFDPQGRALRKMTLQVRVLRRDEQEIWTQTIVRNGDQSPSRGDMYVVPPGSPYFVRELEGIHDTPQPQQQILDANLTPQATPTEFDHAFDIQVSCLTKVFECRSVCELNPKVWRDLPTKEQSESLGRLQYIEALSQRDVSLCESLASKN